MPQMGDVIANAYQRPLYFFSLQINLTFFLHHYSLNRNEVLAIAFINNNHYVAITLKPGAPVPPIVNRWTQFATLTMIRWKLLIQNRIDRFLTISSSSNEGDPFSEMNELNETPIKELIDQQKEEQQQWNEQLKNTIENHFNQLEQVYLTNIDK
ncbi:873_t:CDS:2 [Cetraspora pellucida]|uniref:873_t:CDS:1 n=1 Tax=Cetraspora pellucida TaxID=1433469 RepID=A0A9N9J642_9GLOM|nr:873_t:CDS:2 [Cetraspora pellucida]